MNKENCSLSKEIQTELNWISQTRMWNEDSLRKLTGKFQTTLQILHRDTFFILLDISCFVAVIIQLLVSFISCALFRFPTDWTSLQ